jgi:4-amino-4-deoxy-L-arabinose transferase-like glycosyltransferase
VSRRKASLLAESAMAGLRRQLDRWGLDLLALGLFLSTAALYFWRLDGYLLNDDEGSYLYAAWRIGLGELPYRDFLTPQLPGFLMPGGWLMAGLGPDVWTARALAASLTLAAGLFTWLTARRLFGPGVALVAGAALLLQPEVFLLGRSFRSDPFMLAFAAVATWLFARAVLPRPEAVDPPDRRWLAAAGAGFALATLSKLFGIFGLAGCTAWLLGEAWRRRRPLRAILLDLLALALGFALVLLLGLAPFAWAAGPDELYASVVGHHVRQGADQPLAAVLMAGLAFFTAFLRQNNSALLVFVALAVALLAARGRERRGMLFAWQLPTALAFLFLSREKYPRHLAYLMPALATLFGLGLAGLVDLAREGLNAGEAPKGAAGPGYGRLGRARWLALALLLALLLPWRLLDRDHAYRQETGTEKLADFAQLLTAPDDLLFSDYSELNFYAQRPTTFAAASLSAGAAGSGQITWKRLEEELAGRIPPLVILDRDPEFAHLAFLRDRPAFLAWLAAQYGPPAGFIQRDQQRFAVHVPLDRPLPIRARFADGPSLLAAAPERGRLASGQPLILRTAWALPAEPSAPGSVEDRLPLDEDLGMTLRLLDAQGIEWVQGDAGLLASDGNDRLRLRPTSRWQAGELTSQRLAISLPLGLPAGAYDLVLGVYRRSDTAGLDAFTAEGAPLGQSLVVGQVTVDAWAARPEGLPTGLLDMDLRDEPMSDSAAATAAEASLDAGPRLLGRGALPDRALEAGRLLSFELWWATEAQSSSQAYRLSLSDAASGAVAADWLTELSGVELATGPAPASDTARGPRIRRQRVDLPTEADAGSGSYVLALTWVDAKGAALPGAKPLRLGTVRLRSRDLSGHLFGPPRPAPTRPRAAKVAGLGELLGVDAPAVLEAGQANDLSLVWRALGPTPIHYKISLQLLPEAGSAGGSSAQHDAEPDEGRRPTTSWIEGELIRDAHPLSLPADFPAGRYRLVAAVYHPLTGARLSTNGTDALEGGLLDLGTVQVAEP